MSSLRKLTIALLLTAAIGLIAKPIRADDETPPSKPKKSADTATSIEEEPAEAEISDEERDRLRQRLQYQSRGGFGSVGNLIALPAIQSRLNLNDQQLKEIDEHIGDIQRKIQLIYQEVGELPPDQQRARMAELRVQGDKLQAEKLELAQAALTPAQRMRLTGISLQFRGAQALLDPAIAKQLGLSKEQQETILDLALSLELRSRTLRNNPTDGVNVAQALADLRTRYEQKLFEVLTDEQRTKYNELKGKDLFKDPTPLDPVPPGDQTDPAN